MTRVWTYADHDVSARVESLRRGDRIYLPGHHTRGAGRVVSHLEHYPAEPARPGVPARPETVVVVYFTGERSRPVHGLEAGELGALVTKGLRPLELGTRVRARRCIRAEAARA